MSLTIISSVNNIPGSYITTKVPQNEFPGQTITEMVFTLTQGL